MARPERVLLLAIGLMVGGAWLLPWTMGLLAVTSTYTAVQRIVHVWQVLERPSPVAVREERPARLGQMDMAARGERD
jgi:hypothetical protein